MLANAIQYLEIPSENPPTWCVGNKRFSRIKSISEINVHFDKEVLLIMSSL